jgi:hypothetical protein
MSLHPKTVFSGWTCFSRRQADLGARPHSQNSSVAQLLKKRFQHRGDVMILDVLAARTGQASLFSPFRPPVSAMSMGPVENWLAVGAPNDDGYHLRSGPPDSRSTHLNLVAPSRPQ